MALWVTTLSCLLHVAAKDANCFELGMELLFRVHIARAAMCSQTGYLVMQ
jgi:hypothetical protein